MRGVFGLVRKTIRIFIPALAIGIAFAFFNAVLIKQRSFHIQNNYVDKYVYNEPPEVEALTAEDMATKVRVLCWVMTMPENHEKRCKHIKATWGKRCNKLLFFSTQSDPDLPAIAVNVSEGRIMLWGKTKGAFEYIYKHHMNDADWFFKADDDTYVVVENLRYLLQPYNASDPIYFGCKFKPYVNQGYMSGGAGYVLSREAVKRFVTKGLNKEYKVKCSKVDHGAEDVDMGHCMESLHVVAGDSRDIEGRGRFFPFVPEHHLIPKTLSPDMWYWKNIFYPSEDGPGCCSNSAISFHYIKPTMFYVYDYLLYHLRPFGIDPWSQHSGLNVISETNIEMLRENDHKEWMNSKEKVFKSRREKLRKVCSEVPLLSDFKVSLKSAPSIIANEELGIIYCPIAKAGSTTLKGYIMKLFNITTRDTNDLHLKVEYTNKLKLENMNITTVEQVNESRLPRVAFVRHPFKRLISAFTNKVLMTDDEGFEGLRKKVQGDFTKFVDFVIGEFKGQGINNHWKPQYFYCDFCHINYDYIGKVETFNDDLKFVMDKTGIFKGIEIQSNGLNTSKNASNVDYFSQLDKERRNILRDLYKVDFDLFGYDPYEL